MKLSYQDVKKILLELRNHGVYKLFLTGGEPFLHPDIVDIITLASELEFYTIIQTNASFLNEEMVKKLSTIQNIEFGISFHSSNKEIFDTFTQVKGSFERTLNAGELLKKYKIPFYYKLAVTKKNQEQVREDIQFFEEHDYRCQIFTQIFPDVMDQQDRSEFCVDEEHLIWLYENGYITYQPSSCSAARTKLWVSSSGDVYPCELVRESLGNLVENEFEDIWFSKTAEQVLSSDIYTEPKQCEKCDKHAYCNKCLAYLRYDKWKIGLNSFCQVANAVQLTKKAVTIERHVT